MKRYYYLDTVQNFLKKDKFEIFGHLTSNDQFAAENLQKNSWKKQINILKDQLKDFTEGYIIFEYTIPRIGNRIDVVVLYKGIVFLLEFKVGEKLYPRHSIEQVTDYALDLSCFHKESHNLQIVPVLISTEAPNQDFHAEVLQNKILKTNCCNSSNIADFIIITSDSFFEEDIDASAWVNSLYMPTPTIVEAAQALYRGHNVEDISRNDANAINLSITTASINEIIDYGKVNNRKSICFITGVPGAGKTLAGLNIATDRQKIDEEEHAVFLSGNGPLVNVLQEALARDDVYRNKVKKTEAIRKSKEFIQNIYHFRDDAISVDAPPIEKVAIFDEAQRAWDETNLTNFMKRRKGVLDFNQSEPDFLISVMDRHKDWTTIICLIGGGQEINTGEVGLVEWFDSLRKNFSDWDIYVSDKISDNEYTRGKNVDELIYGLNCKIVPELHLSVSLRSFRSENVSDFVKSVLDINIEKARCLLKEINENYPIYITRDIETAKTWVKNQAKGSQRYGIVASSGAKRLRKYGVWVQSKIDAPVWFLNDKNDVRSSYFLEETATEFDIQGLELDYAVLCWDANLRFNGTYFECFNFNGTKWQNVKKPENVIYLKNAYRVLMTRARQGLVIFVPSGDGSDKTRLPEFYDGVYRYFKEIGIEEI